MYFAIVGKTPQLSLAELAMVEPTSLVRRGKIVFFDTTLENAEDVLQQLAGIVKWGTLYPDFSALVDEVTGASIVGVNDRKLGMTLKKQYGVKRFKEVELEKANLEVKNDGIEVMDLGDGKRGAVRGRQNIDRFAAIDFDKPGRGMQIGMMPSKLAQILVNIGVGTLDSRLRGNDDSVTIWDPFCGFGTTGFVANALGYHFIGSDINITPAKQNQKRRPTTEYADNEKHFTLFKHDVLQPFTKPFLQNVDVIVTEGWLGPVVKSQNVENKGQTALLVKNIDEIVSLYRGFLSNMKKDLAQIPIVMTVPVYSRMGDVIEQRITAFATSIGYAVSTVGEIYQRPKQVVGRRVLLLKYEG